MLHVPSIFIMEVKTLYCCLGTTKECSALYGYLPQTARNLVNNIVDELAKDERLSQLYELWYQQRDIIVQTYHEKGDDRVSLSRNKTFHSIKNVVIAEALNLPSSVQEMDMTNHQPDSATDTFFAVESEERPSSIRVGKEYPFEDLAKEESKKTQCDQENEDEQEAEVEKHQDRPSDNQENDHAKRIRTNHGNTPIALAGFRLLIHLAHMLHDNIEQQQRENSDLVDRKLRKKIDEKKQAQGLKMG